MSTLFKNDEYQLRTIAIASHHCAGYCLTYKKNYHRTIKLFFTSVKFLEDRGKGTSRYELYSKNEKVGEIIDGELPEQLSEKIEELAGN